VEGEDKRAAEGRFNEEEGATEGTGGRWRREKERGEALVWSSARLVNTFS